MDLLIRHCTQLRAEGSQVHCFAMITFKYLLFLFSQSFVVSGNLALLHNNKAHTKRHVRRVTAGKGANDDRYTLEGHIDARMGVLLLHRCIFIYDFLKQNNFVDLRIRISHLADSISGIQSSSPPSYYATSLCHIVFFKYKITHLI